VAEGYSTTGTQGGGCDPSLGGDGLVIGQDTQGDADHLSLTD